MVHGFLCSFSLEMEMEGSLLTIFVFVSPSISTLQLPQRRHPTFFAVSTTGLRWQQTTCAHVGG
jgi:hypothetical protein